MSRWARVRGAVAIAAAIALVPLAASAQTPEDRKRDVDAALSEQSADLHESSVALARAGEALQRIAVQLPAARARVAQAEARLVASRALHAELVARARGARAVLAAAEESVAKAEDDVRRSTDEIAGVVRAAYIGGPLSNVAAILDAGDPSDLLERTVTMQAITTHQVTVLNAQRRTRADLAVKRATLAQRRKAAEQQEANAAATLVKIEALATEAREARRSVERQVAEQAAARRVAERERAADLARYRALRAESRKLAALIRERQSRGTGQIGKGGLLWPTQGPITSRYGYRTHPIYGYRRMHTGVDIGAPSGQSIVAARAGTVVHAGPMGTYGNLVIIDHGNGFSTAYAHQTRVATSDGARVSAGQVIGYVGSTGASTGPHLHYETRVNGEPVDPMRYY
jgi:murein DD-endopeptidase MepM/ murein hydrolase activator NlpD